MRPQFEAFYVLSAELASRTPEDNKAATEELAQSFAQSGVPYILGQGRYKATNETCFLVPAEFVSNVVEAARRYRQESVLLVRSDRTAALLFLQGSGVSTIGSWTETDPSIAQAQDAYTLVDGKYYTIL